MLCAPVMARRVCGLWTRSELYAACVTEEPAGAHVGPARPIMLEGFHRLPHCMLSDVQKNLLEYTPALEWRSLRLQMQSLKQSLIDNGTDHLVRLMKHYIAVRHPYSWAQH